MAVMDHTVKMAVISIRAPSQVYFEQMVCAVCIHVGGVVAEGA